MRVYIVGNGFIRSESGRHKCLPYKQGEALTERVTYGPSRTPAPTTAKDPPKWAGQKRLFYLRQIPMVLGGQHADDENQHAGDHGGCSAGDGQ